MSTEKQKESARQYYWANRQHCRNRHRQWRAKNPERYKQAQQNWKNKDRHHYTKVRRDIYLRNRPKILAYAKRYTVKNRIRTASKRAIRNAQPEVRAAQRAYRLKTADRYRERCYEWRRKNRQRFLALSIIYAARRRAKEMSASPEEVKKISAFILRVRSKPFFTCYYCEKVKSTQRINFDHIEPLRHNGPHSLENLVTCCPSCNGKKWCKPLTVWKPEGQQVFAI